MAKRLFLIGSVLLAAVAAAAFVVAPGHKASTSDVIGSSTSPDGSHAHVVAGGRAFSGPLALHVLRSYTTHRIKNQYVPSTAHGVYLVMDVAATNTTGHTVTFDGGQISLNLDGTRYAPSADALTALDLTGHTTFAEDDLGPSASATGWVVFDVPAGSVASSLELCLDAQAGAAQARC